MSLTVGTVLVAWRETSLQCRPEWCRAHILRIIPDPHPVMFSVINYVCGVCVLTPCALGTAPRIWWAGLLLQPVLGVRLE